MWSIDNRTPYSAQRGWIRDKNGAEVWIVAVKVTYAIHADSTLVLAPEQVPINTGPVTLPDLKSLKFETDLGPSKPATDILLMGHAYAQDGRPATQLPVGFRVGELSRTAMIHGDRYWQRGVLGASPSTPAPFIQMPLIYERAFGGQENDGESPSGNPVGRGITPGEAGKIWLPNLESIQHPIRRQRDRPPVTGFGPISSHWSSRSKLAGTYDQAWFEHRRPLLPEDIDPRFWQAAPPEQQVNGHLKGGETIVLVNVTPPGFAPQGRLAFRLPKLTLAFQTYFYDGTMERSRAVIHTLILEPDYPRMSVVYHMALPCHPKVNLLDRTLIMQKTRPFDRQDAHIYDEFLWPDVPPDSELPLGEDA